MHAQGMHPTSGSQTAKTKGPSSPIVRGCGVAGLANALVLLCMGGRGDARGTLPRSPMDRSRHDLRVREWEVRGESVEKTEGFKGYHWPEAPGGGVRKNHGFVVYGLSGRCAESTSEWPNAQIVARSSYPCPRYLSKPIISFISG